MPHPQRRRCWLARGATPVVAGALLALSFTTLFADPFIQQAIPLPWTDSRDVCVADFDGDGRNDIAALDSYAPFFFECYSPSGPIDCGDRMLLTLHLNQGMGHFAPFQSTLAMCAPWTMVAGDFNGDGFADVMVGNRGVEDAFGVCWQASASFYPGDGHGGFGTPSHRILASQPTDSAAGDFDGDGIQDVVMIDGDSGVVQLLQVAPGGILTASLPYTTGAHLNAVAAGNLDLDPLDEIAIAFQTPQISILKRSPTGALVLKEGLTLTGISGPARSLVIADFNLDFVPDIAAGRSGGGGEGLTLLTRDGNGLYGDPEHQITSDMSPGFGRNLAASDLNADGFRDLATTDGVWHFQTLLGDGTGLFGASPPVATTGATDRIAVGDFDGDGMDDLVTAGPQVFLNSGSILTLLNETQITDQMLVGMDGDVLDWYGVLGATGYDVVLGDLEALRSSGGDYVQSVRACVAGNVASSAAMVSIDPLPGQAWWILGRPRFAGGPGSYDDGGAGLYGPRDPGINASPSTCP